MTGAAARTLPRSWEYALVLLVICASGHPAFAVGEHEPALVALALLMTGLLGWRRVSWFTPASLPVFVAFAVVLLLQSIAFAFLPVVTMAGFLVRLYVALAAVRVVRDFPRLYIDAMCVLAALSLLLWAPDNLLGVAGVPLASVLPPAGRLWSANAPQHLLVHNFGFSQGGLPYRNAGLFWEPTAFAGYLVLGIALLGLIAPRLERRGYRRRLALLTVCVLTTLSTTGYVVLLMALLLHLRAGPAVSLAGRARLHVVYAVLAALAAGGWVIWRSDFVGNKIAQQYTHAVQGRPGSEINRFGTLLFDLEYIRRRPLLGWGLHQSTRYALHPGAQVGMVQGNGLTDFTAKFGLVGLGLFIACTWRGLARIAGGGRLRPGLAVAVILLLLVGETFLNHPLFMALMFLASAPAPSLARSGPARWQWRRLGRPVAAAAGPGLGVRTP